MHYKRWPVWGMKLALKGYIKSFHWLYHLMVFVGVRVATLEATIQYRTYKEPAKPEDLANDLIPPRHKSVPEQSRERRAFLEECFRSPDGSPPPR